MRHPTGGEQQPVMLYEQVTAELRHQIQQLQEGAKIPTEPELMERFGVSRTTIRRAVDTMVSDGLLARRAPKGTFVTRPPFRHALDHPGAFLDTLVVGKSHLTPSLTAFRWVTAEDGSPPPGIGTESLHFERFYTHAGRPCALAHVYIAEPFAREISRCDLEHTPSYEIFTTKLGVTVVHTDATINATETDAALAQRLELDMGTSLIVLHRRMYTENDQLLQHSRHYLPAHQFELTLTHSSQSAGRDAPPAVLRLVSPREHAALDQAITHPERNQTA